MGAGDKSSCASVKRRLRRGKSEFGKKTRIYLLMNASRVDMIHKGRTILDMVFDYAEGSISISSVLGYRTKYENGWGDFPRCSHSMIAVPVDKMGVHVCLTAT